MQVCLVRHAIAHERNRRRWPDDSLRPLTPEGVEKFRKAARGIALLLPEPVVVLTSPYVRARDTAALLMRACRRVKVIECAELGADQPEEEAFSLLLSHTRHTGRGEKTLVLVGHEPGLGRFLSAALVGSSTRIASEFKKGGAALLEFPGRPRPGTGTLKWFLTPRILRSLR